MGVDLKLKGLSFSQKLKGNEWTVALSCAKSNMSACSETSLILKCVCLNSQVYNLNIFGNSVMSAAWLENKESVIYTVPQRVS